ncbi:MAG: hypothetical protein JXB26_17560 [Candidatus Aminicenantes bacterium]|nr:hypothetical protein [Candidatus Aminicenantes bacterium]
MISGSEFEQYVKALLMAFYGYDVEPVSDKVRNDWGCDLVLKSKGIVIQVYGTEDDGQSEDGYADRVKTKIVDELKKIRKNRQKIEAMLGRSIYAWELIIRKDPAPEIHAAAAEATREEKYQVRVLGRAFLKNIRNSVGYNPSERAWTELRKTMLELKKESIFGVCRLDEIFVEPSIRVVLPLQEKKKSERFERRFFQCLLDFIVGPEETEFRGCRQRPAILFGDHGSGKSSALKMVAALLAEDERGPMPVYIPLRWAVSTSSESLLESVKQYLLIHHKLKLTDSDFINRPFCWLFDGFDDLSFVENKKPDWIRKRYQEIISFARPEKSTVILSSRRIQFLGRAENMDMQTARLTLKPFDETRIQRWIQRWTSLASHKNTHISIDGLKRRNLIQECGNPLILFMAARLYDIELSEERPYLRAEMFKHFIDATHGGVIGGKESLQSLPANYRRILQEIATAIFRYSDAGFISMENLKKHLAHSRVVEGSLDENRLKTILTSHFLHEAGDGGTGKTVEFSYQPFREYLVAESFVRLLLEAGREKLQALEWAELCEKMPTEVKLEYIGEILCLMGRDDRLRVFSLMLQMASDPEGLEKKLADLPESDEKRRAVQTAGFTSVISKLMAYYVCSIIMTYGSPEFQEEAAHKNSIFPDLARIYHDAHRYLKGSPMAANWDTLLRFLPGGSMGPFGSWDGFVFKMHTLRQWAVLRPEVYTISLSVTQMRENFFFLRQDQVLDLDVLKIEGCYFSGGTILFRRPKMEIKNCLFINCRLMTSFEPSEEMDVPEMVVTNTLFTKTVFFGDESLRRIFEPRKTGFRAREKGKIFSGETAEKILRSAASILDERLDNNRYLSLIPWTKVIADRLPSFERDFFAELQIFPNDELYRKISFRSEKRPVFLSSTKEMASEKPSSDEPGEAEEEVEDQTDKTGTDNPRKKT